MERTMPPENRQTAEEAFRELETQLAGLRATSKALRERRPSRAENLFHPGRRAKEEAEFGAAVVSALKDFGASIRNVLAEQEAKVAALEREISQFRIEQSEVGRLRERQEGLEKLIHEQAEALATAAKNAGELRQQTERLAREHSENADQLAAGQKDLANEFRERIQHLLDEQRVAIRQLALKASEDAVLSDRARRATELKLEELAQRVPPAPPA
jgi:chromosome segregation ATPase